jgi:hypothetical protein
VLSVSTRADHSPAFAPDGERIVFASNRSANEEIWTSRRDGSEAVQLTAFGNERNRSSNMLRQDGTPPSSRRSAGSPSRSRLTTTVPAPRCMRLIKMGFPESQHHPDQKRVQMAADVIRCHPVARFD